MPFDYGMFIAWYLGHKYTTITPNISAASQKISIYYLDLFRRPPDYSKLHMFSSVYSHMQTGN